MAYDNIKMRVGADKHGNTFDIHPFLRPLAEKVALDHPTWTLECQEHKFVSGIQKDTTVFARSVVITEKREEIGKVSIGLYNNRNCFVIHNERVTKVRVRGSSIRTTDMKKAIKQINKFVARKTVLEMLDEAWTNSNSVAYNVMASKYSILKKSYDDMMPIVVNLLVAQWDTLGLSIKDGFPREVSESRIANEMNECRSNGKGWLVLINGLDYAVQKQGADVQVLTSEQLPDFIRRAVGMLKLVDDSQIIEGAGIRVNANTFFILDEV
jgi:hypothetical protein